MSQKHPLQPRLRSSCDACGEAKIKCDRSQPSCRRCVSQGERCVYGVSRKAGKPPRKRLALQSPIPQRAIEPEKADAGPGVSDTNMFTFPEDAAAINCQFSMPHGDIQPWFPFDGFDSLDLLQPVSSDRDTSLSDFSPGIAGDSFGTAVTAAIEDRPYCTQKSKDIMRRLYCANPSSPASDGVPARILDLGSVLMRNRDVVSRLGLLFKCPCARSPHNAMLYASVISRVLLWYREAVFDTIPGAAPPADSCPSASPSELTEMLNTAALSNDSGVSVLPTPVMVGGFQSDDSDLQTAITYRLILGELKRVHSLIDSFGSLGDCTPRLTDCCPAATKPASIATDASLFVSLGAWLRTEHAKIVAKAKSGLLALREA